MNPRTRTIVQAAHQAVHRLVEICHKEGPLYGQNPPAIAQVNRTTKGFLNALAWPEQEGGLPTHHPVT